MAIPNEEDKLTVKLSANKESSDLLNEQELAGLRHQVVLLAETLEK